MIALVMQGVQFQVNVADPENPELSVRVLNFTDPQSGIVCQIPFDAESWKNFRRHVELDGDVPTIQVPRGPVAI